MDAVLYEKRLDTGTAAEVSEDFTLPDYRPEIRRIAGIRAQASVDGKYLAGNELEADGSVTYTVVYQDADGRLYELSETSSFTSKLPTGAEEGEDHPGAADLILSAEAENAVCRVTGPRKVTLSSRVRLSLVSQKPSDFTLAVPEEAVRVRRKTGTVKTGVMCEARGSFEVSGEIADRSGRIAGAQGSVCVSDVRFEGDRLIFRGEASVTALLARDSSEEKPNGAPCEDYLITRGTAQVEEPVVLPERVRGAVNGADRAVRGAVFPKVILTELETEDGSIRWRMEYDADAVIMLCGEGEITEDAYSPDTETETEEKSCFSLSPAAVRNGRVTLTGRIRTDRDAEFVTAWGTADPGKCAVRGGVAQLNGTAKVTVLTRTGDEFSASEATLPLRYEWEALPGAQDADEGAVTGRMEAGIASITATPSGSDGGTEWSVTAEVWIAAALLSSSPVHGAVRLIPVRTDTPVPKKNVIRVYIPEPGETPWDVGKRFRLPAEAAPVDGVYVI